jgi:acyl-coenzyme A synthetase/AMP-(fatty) acid ligase
MSGPAAVVGRGVNELIQPATRPFTAAAWSAGAMVADFWRWSRSDLLDNIAKLTEFFRTHLVRTARDRRRMTVAWSPSAARAWGARCRAGAARIIGGVPS